MQKAWPEKNCRLIGEIEKFVCIWDFASDDYKNKVTRAAAWREIGAKFEQFSVDECKAKWRNMCTTFRDQRRKITSKKSGQAATNEPNWIF